jgi:hypothetical protein
VGDNNNRVIGLSCTAQIKLTHYPREGLMANPLDL